VTQIGHESIGRNRDRDGEQANKKNSLVVKQNPVTRKITLDRKRMSW